MSQELKPMKALEAELPQLQAILSLNANEGIDVKTLVAQELEYLRMHALTKPEIMDCIPTTVVMAVKWVLKQNLSMDPYAGLVYIKTRGVKINGEWKNALEITKTCNGELSVAYQCGKIKDHKIPTITKKENGAVEKVQFEFQVASGRWETREFDDTDFYRWQRASHKENSKRWKAESGKPQPDADKMNYANENYENFRGGIDPEFARAKAIKHGLKKLGTNPNEGRFSKIVMPSEKKIIIDPEKEASAIDDDKYTAHEEVGSTLNKSAIKPNMKFDTTGI